MHRFTLQVDLPETLHEFVAAQVDGVAFGSESDYIAELVRLAQEATASRRLEELLQQGVESGFAPMTQDDWDGLRRRLEERVRRESA